MGSNVVYNEDTKTWVAQGSSDDTTNASSNTNPNFGKTAEEINYSTKRKFKEEIGIKDYYSNEGETPEEFKTRLNQLRQADRIERNTVYNNTVTTDRGTVTLQGSKAFSDKLQSAINEENKNILNSNSKSLSMREGETLLSPHLLKNPNFSSDFKNTYKRNKAGSETIDVTTTLYNERFNRKRGISLEVGTKRATFFTGTVGGMQLMGVGKGLINVGKSIPLIIGVGALSVTNPVAGATVGYTLGGIYGFNVGSDLLKGKYIGNPTKQAETVTELISFGMLGKGFQKADIKGKLWENKRKDINKDIFDYNDRFEKATQEDFFISKDGYTEQIPKGSTPLSEGIIVKSKTIGYDVQNTRAGLFESNPSERQAILTQNPKDIPILGEIKILQGTTTAHGRYAKALNPKEVQKPLEFANFGNTKPSKIKLKSTELYTQKQTKLKTDKNAYSPISASESISQRQGLEFAQKNIIDKGLSDSSIKQKFNYYKSEIIDKVGEVIKPSIFLKSKAGSLGSETQKINIYDTSKGLYDIQEKTKFKSELKTENIEVIRTDNRIQLFITPSITEHNKQYLINPIVQNTKINNNLITDNIIKNKVSNNQLITLDVKKIQDNKPFVDIDSKIKTKSDIRIITEPIINQDIKIIPIINNVPKPIYIKPTPIISPVEPKPTPKPIFFNYNSSTRPRTKRGLYPAFDVFVKTRGRFIKKNINPLSKGMAFNFGSKIVDKSPQATFKLVQKGTTKENKKFSLGFKFRTSGNNIFTEKNKFRIDSVGEKIGISLKGGRKTNNLFSINKSKNKGFF